MKTKLLIVFAFCTFNLFSQTNLVPNGGFETWTNSTTLSNWTIENSVTKNTSYFTEGSKSAQLSIANSTTKPKITAQVPMTAGKTYTVKFKYKYVTNNYSGQHPISLNISQNGSATTLSSSTFATDNNWTLNETTFTPDQNMSYDLSISLFTFDAAAFNVLIDDVQVYVQGTEQYTLIPDVNFEKRLIALGIDSGTTDGRVLTNSINKLTSLDVSSSSISNLTGIQDFVNLKTLNCYNNQLTTLDVSKNTALANLNCKATLLSTLDITKNIQLESLDISFYRYANSGYTPAGKFTSIDLSQNTILTTFNCNNNPITTLDISKNLALRSLSCEANKLTSLDLSVNISLQTLYCSNNQLTSIIVSKNTALTNLFCENNKLTALDVSKNISLESLRCHYNQLTTLDVSKNVALTNLYCNNNKLASLNLKNGKNNLLTNAYINLSDNASLSCIVVDNVAYSNTNWANKKDTTTFFSPLDCSLVTKIPDAAFEDKLIALGIDTDGKNGVVLNSSIATLTSLNVSNSSIVDLTGVQGFTTLTSLNCSGNLLKKLDLSKNASFSTLNCFNNPSLNCIQVADVAAAANWAIIKDAIASFNLDCTIYTLIPDAKFEDKLISLGIDKDGKNGKIATESMASLTSLDVSNSSITDLTGIQDFVALTTLYCYSNQLTTLDVSKNVSLATLSCYSNQLTTLDVSKNVSLATLSCYSNQLTALDVSRNTALTSLTCSYNQLTSLDVSKNVSLTYIDTGSNKLTTFDVSQNIDLTILSCRMNQLTSLDVSKNVALTALYCNNNNLVSLNLKNGKNTLLTTLNLKDNPSLACILVDDIVYSNNNWANKDVWANYSLSCTDPKYTLIPDVEFEKALIAEKIDTVLDGKILTARAAAVKTLDFYQKYSGISDFTGIEDFTALETLKTPSFFYYESKLVKMNLSKNSALKTLVANYTKLTSLDLSKNTSLIYAEITKNYVLSELNLKNQNNNLLTEANLNIKNNPGLSCVLVDDSTYANTNWANSKDIWVTYAQICSEPKFTLIPDVEFEKVLINSGLDNIQDGKVLTARIAVVKTIDYGYTNYDKITDLTGIEDFTALESLTTPNVNLGKLNVSKNTALKTLKCSSNQLTSLDITNLKNLTSLDCSNNKITSLNINNNVALTTLNTSFNLLTNLDVTNNTYLTHLDAYYNSITDLNVSKNTALEYLSCWSNQLTSLNIFKNLDLKEFYCGENKLTTLDVSKNEALTILSCRSNKLTSLDISKNADLTRLECHNNQLTNLNLKNGKNTLITNSNIDLSGNPNLYCILVDDVTYSNANWTNRKDPTAKFNIECTGLTLPSNNFTVESKGETCTGSKNGEINITGTATYAYKAKINNSSFIFTNNSLKIPNLAPGTYTVSITIPGENFEQSFTVVIPKGANITGKSSVAANKVSVEITEGTAPYTVLVDGIKQFETTDSSFSVETKKGGVLEVKTAKACEGIYAAAIAGLEGAVSAYPNPTTGSFEVQLPTLKKEVSIALYTLDGHLISNKTYTIENGKAQLTLENQSSGVYIAKIELDTPDYLKIIKN